MNELTRPGPQRAGITCIGFTRFRRNTLVGYADLHVIAWRSKLFGVAIHQKGAARWAQPAAKPRLTAAGEVMRDATGKVVYSPIITFDSSTVRNVFSRLAIAAVEIYDPTVFFDDEEGAA